MRLDELRLKISTLYTQGWTQTAIAEKLEMSQQNVCKHLKKSKDLWREGSIRRINHFIEEQLKKLDLLEKTAWEEWENSKKAEVTKRLTTNNKHKLEKGEITTRDQCGDARYLAEINKCIVRRCALLGLDEVPYLIEDPEDEEADVATPDDARSAYDSILDTLRKRAGSNGLAELN